MAGEVIIVGVYFAMGLFTWIYTSKLIKEPYMVDCY